MKNCPSCRDNPIRIKKEDLENYAKEYDKELEENFEIKKNKDEKETELPKNLDELDPDFAEIKDHLQGPHKDICGYCAKSLVRENSITKTINSIDYEFCSEECYHDFMNALEFKDDEF